MNNRLLNDEIGTDEFSQQFGALMRRCLNDQPIIFDRGWYAIGQKFLRGLHLFNLKMKFGMSVRQQFIYPPLLFDLAFIDDRHPVTHLLDLGEQMAA